VVAPFLPDAEKLAAVREALPALSAGIYLNTGSAGPLPAETAAAMAELTDYELRLGRSHQDYLDAFLERLAEARGAVAAVIGADVDSVAIGHSASQAMNLAVWSVDLRPGDRIVTTSGEHAGGLGPVVVAGRRFGAEVVAAEIGDGGNDERTLAALDAAIVPGTRLVALSHVLWTTGARLPIRAIAELARARGAVVAVDGAQAVGAIPVSVADLGVDYYALSGQKWLLGPEGTGALWISPEVFERSLPGYRGRLSTPPPSVNCHWSGNPFASTSRIRGNSCAIALPAPPAAARAIPTKTRPNFPLCPFVIDEIPC